MNAPTEPPDISDTERLAKAQALLRMLKPLVEEESARSPEIWTRHCKAIQRFAEFVDRYAASVSRCELPINATQTSRFGALLRSKREAAGLSGGQLAKLAGLTRQTIDNIENGRVTTVARATMQLLRSVPQLNLQPSEVSTAIKDGPDYNCHIPASYDMVGMVSTLETLLNGPGGHIEQTNAYLEHRSAMVYISDSQSPTYVARFRESYPSKRLAQLLVTEAGQVPLKVIALGPGDGHLEVRFIQHLLGRLQNPQISLVLFDISNALLTCAHKHAKDILQDRVEAAMVQGNFHDLATYPQVTMLDRKNSVGQKRVYLMMGYTMANLDNEPRFFEHSLHHCATGDFLILDFQKRTTPTNASDEEIQRSDPALKCAFPAKQAAWLSIPIRTHCIDLLGCQFSFELSKSQCPIPGSYQIENMATIQTKGKPDRRFSMFRHKRYDEMELTRSLARCGWYRVASIEYGPEKNTVAMLLVKRDAAT